MGKWEEKVLVQEISIFLEESEECNKEQWVMMVFLSWNVLFLTRRYLRKPATDARTQVKWWHVRHRAQCKETWGTFWEVTCSPWFRDWCRAAVCLLLGLLSHTVHLPASAHTQLLNDQWCELTFSFAKSWFQLCERAVSTQLSPASVQNM